MEGGVMMGRPTQAFPDFDGLWSFCVTRMTEMTATFGDPTCRMYADVLNRLCCPRDKDEAAKFHLSLREIANCWRHHPAFDPAWLIPEVPMRGDMAA